MEDTCFVFVLLSIAHPTILHPYKSMMPADQLTFIRWNVRDVGNPLIVWSFGVKLPIQKVLRNQKVMFGVHSHLVFFDNLVFNAISTHDSGFKITVGFLAFG